MSRGLPVPPATEEGTTTYAWGTLPELSITSKVQEGFFIRGGGSMVSGSRGPMSVTAGFKRARRISGDRQTARIKRDAHRRVRRSVRQQICEFDDDQMLMQRGACERVVC